jgi:hypothetical protein
LLWSHCPSPCPPACLDSSLNSLFLPSKHLLQPNSTMTVDTLIGWVGLDPRPVSGLHLPVDGAGRRIRRSRLLLASPLPTILLLQCHLLIFPLLEISQGLGQAQLVTWVTRGLCCHGSGSTGSSCAISAAQRYQITA